MKQNISKRIQELLQSAPVRQRALVICHEWQERSILQETALITQQEADAIFDSIKTPEEKKEFWHYIHLYDVYADFAPIFGLARATYRDEANNVVGYLRELEAYIQIENHLNTIYSSLKDTGDETAIETFKEHIRVFRFTHADAKVNEDGLIEIDCSDLWDAIETRVKERVIPCYEQYKAIIAVTEEWTKRNRAKAFMPEIVKQSIEEAKEDYALEVAPAYSRKELQKRIDKGERIGESERKKAIFPYYEEIVPSEDTLQVWRDKLTDLDKQK